MSVLRAERQTCEVGLRREDGSTLYARLKPSV
jgi:hypothetical protein